MRKSLVSTMFGTAILSAVLLAQQETTPIYRVTVVERTAKAVNYHYRSGPTLIDFRGTVLMPEAKGVAMVESRKGRTEVDAGFERLKAPQRFGREYLTYVLWAISPEGRPTNMGEVIPGHSDKARLKVTTDLQAFAMIVTAEPYSSVRQPSDVVVMENIIRPDTYGTIKPVDAKYELLPRGQYTYNISPDITDTPKVSGREYDTLVELYQAQNAVGIAGAAGAQQYAPNTYAKAVQLLQDAQQFHNRKDESGRVISLSREASQTAEDARLITVQKQQTEKIEAARADVSKAQSEAEAALKAKQDAELAAQQARAQAQAAVERADAERAARTRAEAEAAAAREAALQAANRGPNVTVDARSAASAQASAMRARILEELNGVALVRDTPRGLVITVAEPEFTGENTRDSATAQLARVASILARHPGLHVNCEGYSADTANEVLAQRRADFVRNTLVSRGLTAAVVTAKGFGTSRPIVSGNSPEAKLQNSRVEVVVWGDPIGTVPFWDRTYTLKSGGD